jgi:hypothetical protein
MLRKLGCCLLGKRVVVLGQGQNGLMATQLCADMKARRYEGGAELLASFGPLVLKLGGNLAAQYSLRTAY